ncbi:MAG: amidotransferase [Spirochaetae bacterium HGW-Spirochaetae-1]|nr:MAG: amidotransferase [Spirochaetae bacterium HGW-Spirochaetae-1]
MRAHCIQHVPFEGPAHAAVILRELGMPLSGTRVYAGEALPDPGGVEFLLVMGGPMGVHDGDRYPWLKEEMLFIEKCISRGATVLGICLGAQLIAHVMGAQVRKNPYREIGWFPVTSVPLTDTGPASRLVLPQRFTAFHWHGDTFDIPRGAVHLARSEACENQAFIYDDRVLGLQFHLESTPESVDLLIENARHELDGSAWVQDARELSRRDFFSESNGLMKDIMENLVKGNTVSL